MREKISNDTKIKWVIAAALAVFTASLISFVALLYFHSIQEEELRKSLIANCEKNGNPLREVLQHRIQKEIVSDQNQKLLEKILPDTPKKSLEIFAKKAIKELMSEELEIKPVDCNKAYTK